MKPHHFALLYTVLTTVTSVHVTQAIEHKNVQEYERVPFDVGLTQLPPHFAGHNVEAIYKALKAIPPKSEYETSAVYKTRSDAARSKVLYGFVQADSAIAVVMPLTNVFHDDETVSLKYDADAGLMRITVKAPDDKGLCDDCPPVLVVTSRVVDSGTYVGRTAFGVRSIIKKHYLNAYGVTADPWPFINEYSFPLKADEARALHSHLRLILVGHIHSPWTSDQDEFRLPNIDNPLDQDAKLHAVGFQSEELWVVDISTGEILKKFR